MLAGALTGGSCSRPGVARFANNMLSIFLDPRSFQPEDALFAEIDRFIAFVKGARPASPGAEILMPGEIEERTRAARLRDGIELDDTTWGQIVAKCEALQVSVNEEPGPSQHEAAG